MAGDQGDGERQYGQGEKDFVHCLLYYDDVAYKQSSSVLRMKNQADPMLLSLLQKIANPISELDFTVTLKGVFAPSEQWKQSDEANPNVFSYSLELQGNLFAGGKIQPRKLTQKQLKEQEEAKNKKGGKKEAKEEEKLEQIDPEAEQRKKQWQALSEEERFYRTQEDPYKAFSLLWADNTKEQKLSKDSLRAFEDAVTSGKLQISMTRRPEGGEQEIAKLKKAKAKGLNLGELYSAVYKGILNIESLCVPGAKTTLQRVPLQFSCQLPPDCVRIDCDKCYALVEITMSQPINPLVLQQKPTARDLLGQPKSNGSEGGLLVRLKDQIRKGMRALSQQYSAFFAKEKDHTNDDRRLNTSNNTNLLTVSTLRINEISKRKEQFLNEFASSGKYNILRERLAKTVKSIVIDRCRKEKSGAGMNKEHLQKILSQLNVYLRQMMEKTLDQAISAEAAGLHQDLVLGHQYNRASRKQTLSGIGETSEEKQSRLAQEYQIINKIPQACAKFMNLVILNNHSLPSLENYARFYLRHAFYDQAYAIYDKIASESSQFKHHLVISFFKAQRGREQEATDILNQLAEGEASSEEKSMVHNMLSFLFERLGEEKKSQKHQALAEKYFQMKSNPQLKTNPPKNPYIEPTPRVPKPGKYISQLSGSEMQQLRLGLMNYFIDYGFFKLARDYLKKLTQSDRKSIMIAQILLSQQKYDQSINLLQGMLEKDNQNMELLMLKAQVCFLSERLFECQEVFLYLLKLKPSTTYSYSIYLRLGLTYLNRKSWEDAKATFNKAVELKPNSSAGWLGLGVANLRLCQLKESEEALNLSRIYNPLSTEVAQYLKQIEQTVDKNQKASYQYLNSTEN